MGSHIRIEIQGQTFGQWTVLAPSHQNRSGNWYWTCQCSCGTIKNVEGSKLRTEKTTKCQKCSGKDNGRKGLYTQNKGDPVYFIRCLDYIKIGSSKDIDRRFKDLQSSNPYSLELIAVDEDEEFWHKVFEHRLHKGEWYEFEQPGIEELFYQATKEMGW